MCITFCTRRDKDIQSQLNGTCLEDSPSSVIGISTEKISSVGKDLFSVRDFGDLLSFRVNCTE